MRRAVLGLLVVSCALLAFPLASFGQVAGFVTPWTGTWSRSEDGVSGNLILVETPEKTVTGRYTWNDGSGVVSGTVEGATLTGSFNETHYKGSFQATLTALGSKFTGSYSGENKDTQDLIVGPFDGTCVAGECLQNNPPPTPPSTDPGSTVSSSQVASLSGEVTVVHADGSRETLAPGASLKRGDQLETGVDSHVVLSFPDGSKMTLPEMTQVEVADLLSQGSRQRVTVSLKLGEISALVNPKKEYQTDFKVTTPSGTTSSRGTRFAVFYDPGSRATVTSVTQHTVVIDPTKRGLRTVTVPSGKEVEVTPTSISPLAPLGKADAHGGIDRAKAYTLAVAALGKAAKACGLTPPAVTAGFSVKPAASGWLVTIPVAGNVKGLSTWAAAGGQATPLNALAKQIASGCQGVAPRASAAVTFTQAGSPLGQPIAAPQSANDLEANLDPHTGVIANAYWTKDGKSVAAITVAAGANGLIFAAAPGGSPGAPVPRPASATGFHVFWDQSGAITSATWTRVGKPLAAIPVSSGLKAIAFTNGAP